MMDAGCVRVTSPAAPAPIRKVIAVTVVTSWWVYAGLMRKLFRPELIVEFLEIRGGANLANNARSAAGAMGGNERSRRRRIVAITAHDPHGTEQNAGGRTVQGAT